MAISAIDQGCDALCCDRLEADEKVEAEEATEVEYDLGDSQMPMEAEEMDDGVLGMFTLFSLLGVALE